MIKEPRDEMYHSDPRNKIERFLVTHFQSILDVYGLNKISLYMRTEEDDDSRDVFFNISYKPSYKTAFIDIKKFAIEYFNKGETQTILNAFVHEVAHLITYRMKEIAHSRNSSKKEINESVEEVTETIAQIARRFLAEIDSKKIKR